MKTCKKCGAGFDGVKCKACWAVYSAAYRAANPEKERERVQKWRAENPEKAREKLRKWRAANLLKTRAYAVSYYWVDPEKSRAKRASWQKENPEACRINNQNRRAKRLMVGGVLSKGLSEKLLKLQRGKCACCGETLGTDFHRDHNMPLALGGTNTDDNIQLLCQTCNLSKHAKHPIDFMQTKGFLL